ELAVRGHFVQVRPELAAVADGDLDLPPCGGRLPRIERASQHAFDLVRQLSKCGAGAGWARLIMHGDRIECGDDVGNARDGCLPQGGGRGRAAPSDFHGYPVAEYQQQGAVALRDDGPALRHCVIHARHPVLRRAYLANSESRFLKDLNSSALPEGSRKNMVACSPTSPLKRT